MTERKISPFQLTALLVVGRLCTLLTQQPPTVAAGSFFVGIAVGLALQLPLALLLQRLALLPPSGSKGMRLLHTLLLAVGLLLCFSGALWTAIGAARLLSDSFYGGQLFWLLLLLLLLVAVVVAAQGLQGFCRAAPLFALLCLGGVAVLLLGAAPGLQLDYLPPLTVELHGVVAVAVGGTLANLELLLLPLLVGRCTKPLRKTAVLAWLGGTAAIAAVLGLFAMLSLGWYVLDKPYPVRELARTAPLLDGRLDALLLGLWVLPALLRLAALLWLVGVLWGRLFPKGTQALRRKLLRGGTVACLLLLLAGCAAGGGVASKTLVTLVELSPAEQGVTLQLEYLDISGGKDKQRFGVCSGEGATFAEALGQLEQDFSRRFYLDSVSLAVLSGKPDASWVAARLAELDAPGGLRPRTNLLQCDEAVLKPESDSEQSAATPLRRLFEPHGQLPRHYTLKDALARLHDSRLTLQLPLVQQRDGQPVVAGYSLIK